METIVTPAASTTTHAPRLFELGVPRRVAVVRALHLGDLLCAVPALRALRAALPEAEITLIGLPWAESFVRRFDRYLDRFLEFPGYPGLPEREPRPDHLSLFLAAARRAQLDLALQMHGSGRVSNAFTALLGARLAAGFCPPGPTGPDPRWFLPYPEHEPEVRRHVRLLEFLGIPPRGEELEFPLREADHAALGRIEDTRPLRRRGYVCVHPGARARVRRWPPERFALVADALGARGLQVVLTGAAEEVELTGAVGRAMRMPYLDLAGRTDLGALAALLAGARLVVGNDTGISHLAAALQIPSVVVFSTSDRARWAPLDGDRHRAVGDGGDDGRVFTEAPGASVSAEAVLREALDLLGA
jgi:ADP-heptose:LPS heptosyltransferase